MDVVSIKLSLLIAKENIPTGLIRLEIRIYPAVRDHDRSKRIDKCDLITDNCDTRKAVCLSITFPHSFSFTRAELYFPREKNRIGELVSCVPHRSSFFFFFFVRNKFRNYRWTDNFNNEPYIFIYRDIKKIRPVWISRLLLMIEKKEYQIKLSDA